MTDQLPTVVRDHDRIIDLLNNNPEDADHVREVVANAAKAGVPPRGILSIINTDTRLPIRIDEPFLYKYFPQEMENGRYYLEAFVHMKLFEAIAAGDSKVLIEMSKQMKLFEHEEEKEEDLRPVIEVPATHGTLDDWQKQAVDSEDTEEKIQRVLDAQKKKKKRGRPKKENK